MQSPSDPQTLNRYSYCRNNPLALIDPSGHGFFSDLFGFFESFFEAFFAAFAGGVVGFLTQNPILGGMVAGAIMGAFSGNITNVVLCAATAGMAGGLPFPVALVAQAGMLGYSAARNGPYVLIGFTGGLLGGITGGLAAKMVGDSLDRAIDSNIAQAADYGANVSQTNSYQDQFKALPEDERYADTRITWSGDIKITHYDPYYQLDASCQDCIDVHENVHVAQFEPYRVYGYFGNIAYWLNGPTWELPAYNAQYDCLTNALAATPPNTTVWYAITDEITRVGNNIVELNRIINNN